MSNLINILNIVVEIVKNLVTLKQEIENIFSCFFGLNLGIYPFLLYPEN